MSQTVTFNASKLGWALHNSTSWDLEAAAQGSYHNTSTTRTGIIIFSTIGTSLTGKIITGIKFSITAPGSGSDSSRKVLTFKESNYQDSSPSGRGDRYPSTLLGTLTGKFFNNTTSHTLNASTNTEFFNNLSSYLSAGNHVLILHNGEKSPSSTSYSSNYAKISAMSMTVTYEEPEGAIYHREGTTWKKGTPYVYHNGSWVKGEAYIYHNGVWTRSKTV